MLRISVYHHMKYKHSELKTAPSHLFQRLSDHLSKFGLFPVIQYEQPSVDFAHRESATTCGRCAGYEKIYLALPSEGPHLQDGLPQLHISLVHLFCRPHLVCKDV